MFKYGTFWFFIFILSCNLGVFFALLSSHIQLTVPFKYQWYGILAFCLLGLAVIARRKIWKYTSI